jgi:hypothetical protein
VLETGLVMPANAALAATLAAIAIHKPIRIDDSLIADCQDSLKIAGSMIED